MRESVSARERVRERVRIGEGVRVYKSEGDTNVRERNSLLAVDWTALIMSLYL